MNYAEIVLSYLIISNPNKSNDPKKDKYTIKYHKLGEFDIRINNKLKFKYIKTPRICVYNFMSKYYKEFDNNKIHHISTNKKLIMFDPFYKCIYYKKNNNIKYKNSVIGYDKKHKWIYFIFFNRSKEMTYEINIKYYNMLKYKKHYITYYNDSYYHYSKYTNNKIFISNKYELLYISKFFLLII